MNLARIYSTGTALIALTLIGMPASARERIRLDDGWRFHQGDSVGAHQASHRNDTWSSVTLPHDWSIAGLTDPKAATTGSGGFFPTGIGWYRRTLQVPESWAGQCVSIEFEGVYRNAEVWINGQSLGLHPYGYTPFVHDLTPHLNPGSNNVLAVRVDNSAQPNTRWYSGSGIYRHVWLHVTDPIHIAPQGVFITTSELSSDSATVRIRTEVTNASPSSVPLRLDLEFLNPKGKAVAAIRILSEVPPHSSHIATNTISIEKPRPWSPETPALYTAIARVLVEDRVTDEVRTSFGIRTLRASAEGGFELNGQAIKLMGGNVHHDNGPLGAAAFDRAEQRRTEILKAAGINAIRTSHNPPSPAFLDACDRLGLLVMDEAFDGWAKKKMPQDYGIVFRDWWERDLDAMVLRDRNHPSVVMWSIGNEVYERGDPSAAQLANEMRKRILSLDTSRPITAGINGLGQAQDWPKLDALFASLDIAGYNYEDARVAADHDRLPDRVIALTESYQSNTFGCWVAVNDHPYVIGDFVWSALDYLGEAGIGKVFPPGAETIPHWKADFYPMHGAACGDIDITGWRKPISHYRNIVWDRGETLYAAVIAPSPNGEAWSLSQWSTPPALPSWTWPGQEGKPLQLEVYSRHDAVRVWLNKRLIGDKPTTREQQFKATFTVNFEPGTVRITGMRDGREVESTSLTTAGEARRLRLAPDRERIRADGQDLSFVNVEVTDPRGRLRMDADRSIRYELTGPGEIAGIGGADLTSTESYQANPRRTYQGRALVIIRSTGQPGRITLRAESEGLKAARTVIWAK